jgi:hypothetical protein
LFAEPARSSWTLKEVLLCVSGKFDEIAFEYDETAVASL